MHIFLKVLYGGDTVLENDQLDDHYHDNDDDGGDDDDNDDDSDAEIDKISDKDKNIKPMESTTENRILSVGQDLVYGISKGKRWTPKHLGLGSTLHQMTRSKQLVKLFHKAGHIISYRDIMTVDNSLAEFALKSLHKKTGAVVPEGLTHGKYVHFSEDNIDILDSSLDGKNTFNATQVIYKKIFLLKMLLKK